MKSDNAVDLAGLYSQSMLKAGYIASILACVMLATQPVLVVYNLQVHRVRAFWEPGAACGRVPGAGAWLGVLGRCRPCASQGRQLERCKSALVHACMPVFSSLSNLTLSTDEHAPNLGGQSGDFEF